MSRAFDLPPALQRRWPLLYAVGVVLLCAPYAASFASQLCSDDFILLYYYGRKPLWKVWEFFSPRTIWTYHPLQHYYYAVAYNLSGIEPYAYRAMSLALHWATAFLLQRFGRTLTGSMHFGGCSALLFAGSWRHWEAVAWAGSIATVQSTLCAIGACAAFLSYLHHRRRSAYGWMLLATAGWFFSKETIIQLPLLLAAIYIYAAYEFRSKARAANGAREGERAEGTSQTSQTFGPFGLRDFLRVLALPTGAVVLYLAFYAVFVRNVYPHAQLGYEQAPIWFWPYNVLRWLDFALNPLYGSDLSRVFDVSWLLRILARLKIISLLVLIITLYLAWRWKRFLPLLALAIFLISTVPYVILDRGFMGSRYHYGPALGASLLAVSLGRELWHLARGRLTGWQSGVRIAVAGLGGIWLVVNFFQLALSTLHDRDANRPARELFDFFATQTDKKDRPVLFVVDTQKEHEIVDVELGWGLLEAARLALGSDRVAAVELGYDLEPHLLAELNGYPEKYLVRHVEDGDRWIAARLADSVRLALVTGPDKIPRVAFEERNP
ncbi:MAG: hypothetical protein N3D11_01815 [Candidatus Sumerlaeia bacterium]|nr:hypothetical protein [Candidatus Sumerlaeia bacterium]